MSGHIPWAEVKAAKQPRKLTWHQLETLQLYQQLGTIEAVADYRMVQVQTINNTLRICRQKLGVKTSREAVLAVPALARLASTA